MSEFATRSVSLAPSTYNATMGTVEAVLSTGAGVPRRDARGPFMERLSTAPGAVTLHTPRLPVLDTHRQRSVADVMGYVSGVRSEGGNLVSTLTITSPQARALVESGTVTGVSIGYRGTKWSETDNGAVRTADNWTLMEVSLVPVPADSGASLRSAHTMEPSTETTTTTIPAVVTPPAPVQARAEVNTAIRTLGTSLGLGTPWADATIDAGADLPTARLAALSEIERRSAAGIIRVTQTAPSGDDPATISRRFGDALAHRLNATIALPDDAVQFRGLSVIDMARNMLMARGERGISYMGAEAILTRAVTTGDLPQLLAMSGNRSLLAAYQAAPNPVRALARQSTVPDFRAKKLIRLGEMQTLALLPESGEVPSGGIAESAEGYTIGTYARIFSLTRQAMINDDLGAFADLTGAMGRAAAETEAKILISTLLGANGTGPIMEDLNPLFDPDHGNYTNVGTPITTAGLSVGRQALRVQTGTDGVTPINATAKYLLVSAAKETEAEQALSALFANILANTNPFVNKLQVLVDPRLTGLAWYLFADPAVLPCLEYSYLSAAPGPQMVSRPGWEVLGMEFRCHLDFGAGAIDWRGAYKNAGA